MMNLQVFYLTKALNHYRFMLDKNMYEQIEYNFDFIDYIFDFLMNKDKYFKNKLKIKLHLNEALLIKEKEEKYYDVLKQILINEHNKLSQSDLYSLHNILQSHCVYMGYQNHTGYTKERFELYKICLKLKLYAAAEHIYFDDLMFGNIVSTAITIGDLEFTENFIEQYKNMLAPDNTDVVINYSYSRLYFGKKDFEKALWHLNNIKSIKHIQYKLPVRDLVLKCYYELGLTSQAVYYIDSYRHFLNNNRSSLSDERFERISNFLRFYTRLVKCREKNSGKDFLKLKEDVESTPNTLERNWLLVKTGEFLN